MSFRRFVRDNGLALALLGIFSFSIIGMSLAGHTSHNTTLKVHHQPELSYREYLTGGEFIEGVFENWESEFLQMWALIVLTIYLRQKGSADSKPMRGKAKQDTSSRYAIIQEATWSRRGKAARHFIYSHSLSLAMFSLFTLSFLFHALGGVQAYNQENQLHGSEAVGMVGYVSLPQFWYESLQNWQSEFLAIGVLLILSIKLRERGSPQSKPVGKAFDHETG